MLELLILFLCIYVLLPLALLFLIVFGVFYFSKGNTKRLIKISTTVLAICFLSGTYFYFNYSIGPSEKITQMAIQEKDPSWCRHQWTVPHFDIMPDNGLIPESNTVQCYKAYIRSYPDISICDELTDFEGCATFFAQTFPPDKAILAACQKNNYYRSACLKAIAEKTQDPTICLGNLNFWSFEDCIANIQNLSIFTERDFNVKKSCEDLGGEPMCFSWFAKIRHDESICHMLSDEQGIAFCLSNQSAKENKL